MPRWTRRFAVTSGMAMLPIKSVYVVRAKGRTYVYAWRGGPRVYAPMGTPEFVQELAELTAERSTVDNRKLRALIIRYEASEDWKKLADKTRASWTLWLRRIQEEFGAVSIAAFDRPLIRVAIRRWRDKYKATPRAADMGLQVLSRLLSFGMEEGLLKGNAVEGVSRLYSADRSGIIWTEDDFKALKEVASAEVYRAVRLAALTGLRKSDLLRLSWSHIKAHSIEIPTGKSGSRKTTLIPIYGELRRFLDAIPRKKLVTTVLTNTRGKPWRSGFGSSLGDDLKKAGIDKHLHDTRGTAATRMYVGGLTIREISEMFTWAEAYTEQLINTYVKKDELMLDRIRRLEAAEQATAGFAPGGDAQAQ
jgi:integrase